MCCVSSVTRFCCSVKPSLEVVDSSSGIHLRARAFNPPFFPHHLSTTTHVTTSVLDHGVRTCGMSSDSALPLVGSHRAKPPVAAPIRVRASRCTRLPTLHASLLRSWTTVFVPAECLRTVPCPLWESQRPSRRTQHLYGSCFIRCKRLSFPHDCAYRNCATPLTEWHYLTTSARRRSQPLAAARACEVRPPRSTQDRARC